MVKGSKELSHSGGPGNSGVSFVLRSAPAFRVILGGEFDLIGFDPRGAETLFAVCDISPNL